VVVELDCIETHSLEDFHGCLETFVSLKVVKFASAGQDVEVESWGTGHTNPFAKSVCI
jgi:hypothetical protein